MAFVSPSKDVVEVVRDTRGHLAKGLEFFGSHESYAGILELGIGACVLKRDAHVRREVLE